MRRAGSVDLDGEAIAYSTLGSLAEKDGDFTVAKVELEKSHDIRKASDNWAELNYVDRQLERISGMQYASPLSLPRLSRLSVLTIVVVASLLAIGFFLGDHYWRQ